MTPAIILLERQKISYQVLKFDHDPDVTDFAQEATEALALSPNQVFKTLVINVDGKLSIAVTPASKLVDLKVFAKRCKGKKAQLATQQQAENATGYQLGGISPFAHKKRLPVILHSSALSHDTIYVSGGRRGLELAVSPIALQVVCSAQVADF
ncbi:MULTISPECIES: aminoacyl-tRNA deacylase [unclassified Pseudoalteromonas]|uniref:aminoacyl-tRNA deacylase n=1 Tax=unclassified Pseudoalteromonas TaxID=194690 RepID=UPI0020978B10|nr:aminoacyl-tRNA deacylase [Pseudoalteromonas sp. XMcav2-N]MCO7190528.1 aminoacyl-tRNA deacylase [Pseudoalteromonas sp. XMcav2-N]